MSELAAIIKVFMEPTLKAERPAQAPLRPGTVLNGRVVDVMPGGLLQINFGKFRTQTRVRFPVDKGDTLRFEVLETGDRIKMKIQDQPPAANKGPHEQPFKPEDLQRFRQQIETALHKIGPPNGVDRHQADKVRLLVTRLSHVLPALPAGRTPDQLAPLIKALLTNSGIFFEKKLESVLLALFKSPQIIDVGRAAAHPFVTSIFDNDAKPNLLKLLKIFQKTAPAEDSQLASFRAAAGKLIKHIEFEQTRLIRTTPTGSGNIATAYTRGNSSAHLSNGRLPGPQTANIPASAMQTLQLHLAKTGLQSDPQIRNLITEWTQSSKPALNRYAGPLFAPRQRHGPVARQLPLDTQTVERGALQKVLAGMIKTAPAPNSKALTLLLSDYRDYIQANQLRLDAKTEKAVHQLEAFSRTPVPRSGSPGFGTNHRSEAVRQNLQILAQFIKSRPPRDLAGFRATPPRTNGEIPLPDRQAAAEAERRPSGYEKSPHTDGSGRPAFKTTGREIIRMVNLIKPKAAALRTELDRVEKTLVEFSTGAKGSSTGNALCRIVRSLQVLLERNQTPTDEAVKRILASLAVPKPATGTASAATLNPGPLSENRLADLAVLREFINLQKMELTETLDILRGLRGWSDADTETGDRPGPDRGRGADPMQVITFTLPMEEGQNPARLKVFYPLKKNTATGAGFRISLLLTMERMGPVRADIFACQHILEVKFSTENQSACQHIDNHLSRLGNLLNGVFETVNLTAAVDEKNISAFEYEDLEMSGDRLVDLQA